MGKSTPKYKYYAEEIFSLHEQNYTNSEIAKILQSQHGVSFEKSGIQKFLKRSYPDYRPRSAFGGDYWNKARQLRKENPKNDIEAILTNSNVVNDFDVQVHSVWDKSNKDYSILYKSIKKVMTFDEMQASLLRELKDFSPKIEPIKRDKVTDPHLLTPCLFDLHIGKLADPYDTRDEYNHKIAEERAFEGIEGIISKSSGFPTDTILLPIGQDMLHVDNKNNTTTNGTRQDVSQMFYRSFNQALSVSVKLIQRLLSVAKIHIVLNPSNHDYQSCFMLAQALYCWFRESPDITWDIDMTHRKYFKYGNSLIGTTHGDGGDFRKLPQSMSHEAKAYWSECNYYYWYLGHIHHKQKYQFKASEDSQGVSVEYMRSASGTDSWHAQQQYANNLKAIDAMVNSMEHGQVARITHLF